MALLPLKYYSAAIFPLRIIITLLINPLADASLNAEFSIVPFKPSALGEDTSHLKPEVFISISVRSLREAREKIVMIIADRKIFFIRSYR